MRVSGWVLLLAVGLLPLGCGDRAPLPFQVAGVYVLDRRAFAEALFFERVAEGGGLAAHMPTESERQRFLQDARQTAQGVSLRLDLSENGTFVVRYHFGRERGRLRGAWTRHGGQLTLRTTQDAAGPIQRGAQVQARVDARGLHFGGWPVPHDFTLLRQAPASGAG